MAEVMDAAQATAKYQSAIALIAGSDGGGYVRCGEERFRGGVKAVAECMKELKGKTGLPVWAEKYKRAYEGKY